MKRCPQCNRVESDEALKFCRVDGATLVSDSSSSHNEARNPLIGPASVSSESETRILSDRTDANIDRGTAPATTAIPPVQTSTAPEQKIKPKRRLPLIAVLVVTGVIVVTILIGGYLYFTRTSGAPINSIAVLPFENENHDPESDYLADGLSESIIYRLSQLPNLKVSPRSSVFHYKGKESDPLKVGNELGVAAVLSGRITQRGDQITISTELTDVKNNKLLWGERYDRKISELLTTQREIAREIADRLKITIAGEDQRLTNKHYTESNEAYQSYLKGRYYWNKRTRDGYSKAIDNFKAAIDRDPSFALAYAGLSDSYNILSSYGLSRPNESFPLGKAAALKALELDPDLAEVHTSLAYERFQYEWDWSGGEREFKRAIELNPSYPTAHHWYGLELATLGRLDEAFAELKKAQDLDPLSLVITASTAWTLFKARRYDDSIAQFQKSLDLDQNFSRAHWGIAEPYVMKGNYDKAIAELQLARQLDDSTSVLTLLADTYARAGRKADAQKILAELNEQRKIKYVDAYYLAEVYAALGENNEALKLLEDAYNERSSLLIWLKLEPKFDPLRSDRRYADLVQRIGLPK